MRNYDFIQLEQSIDSIFNGLVLPGICYVAYSGGMDSTVLLSVVSRLKKEHKVCAVYIDHGLQQESLQWAQHCSVIAKSLSVDYVCKKIKLDSDKLHGESIEACAREARYACFKELLKSCDVLLTAHHQRDQAETLLLQLIRGAGPTGLSSMPKYKELGLGQLIRPFLDINYSSLLKYAQAYDLKWIDDPSNLNTQYDRNHIRHAVMPILEKRWPSVSATLARSASLCADIINEQDQTIEPYWHKVFDQEHNTLCWRELQYYSIELQRLLLRKWFKLMTGHYPSIKQLGALQTMLEASNDKIPCFSLKQWEVYRYRNKLFLFKKDIENYQYNKLCCAIPQELSSTEQVLINQPPFGKLLGKYSQGAGIAGQYIQTGDCRIGFRQGGERVKPQGRIGSHPLKKLLQEAGIVPWMRYKTPLVFYKNEVIALPNCWVAEQYSADKNETGVWVYSET